MGTEAEKPLVLIISNFYLPGSGSGGGTRTIVNTVERLSDRLEFRIITRGYDAGPEKHWYDTDGLGQWNRVGKAEVYYLKRDSDIRTVLPGAVRELNPAVLYANSFFSPLTVASLRLRKQGRTGGLPFILAPCGELSKGARRLKLLKKAVFLRSAVAAGLYSGIIWKASSELEAEEIGALRIKDAEIHIAPDLPPAGILEGFDPGRKPPKDVGSVRLVFVSRFDRKKNLKWLLDNVNLPPDSAKLDVFGTVEDDRYLEEFLEAARIGRSGIDVSFKGPLEHAEVACTLFKYHFKVMPTLGENFGHVFLESLAAGCPLIISDRTPWIDLEAQGAGWSVSLKDPERWQEVLKRCVAMGDDEYRKMSVAAREYADSILSDPSIEKRTVELIESAILSGDAAAGGGRS
ncbi:MAG TPA: glycosyltransferase [Aridibacter sp.]|nr:glycosyltransferase [Aridibacter sp.]